MKISIKFIVIIESLVVISIAASGFMAFSIGVESIKEKTEVQLESIIILKTNQLNDFIEEKKSDVETIAIEQFFTANFTEMLMAHNVHAPDEMALHENIGNLFKRKLALEEDFIEFFVLDLDGKVHLSTDETQEGKLKLNEDFFIVGKEETFVQSFYYDMSLEQSAMTISTPIKDDEEIVIGVLAGRINLEEISKIMTERIGLGETGETYLVNDFNFAVTELRKEEAVSLKKAIYTQVIEDCLKEKTSTVQFLSDYLDYAEDSVIGAYTYLSEMNVCLIAEIDQNEALAPMIGFRNNLIFVSFFVVILTLILGYFISRTVTKPIKTLSEMTKKISEGNLDIVIKIDSKDEIGSLAKSFDKMRKSLKMTRSGLLKSQETLEKKVEERTRELNEKITESKQSEAATLSILEDLHIVHEGLKKSQKRIKLQNIKLKKLDRIKSDFLNVTSHELRTPMSAIKGYIQMIMKQTLGEITEEQEKALNIVLRNTDRLDHLIQDILDISRLESGTMKFIPEQTDIKNMVEETVETMQSSADLKHITINTEMEDKIPGLTIDQERIKQVIINIMSNAIKFSPDGSIINVQAKKDKNNILFGVQDFGRGIPKDKQKKIFETFYQVDSGMDRKFGGAGLGLAISRGIVLAHGGQIWADSMVGKGSTFYFTLPIESVVDLEEKFKGIDIFGLKPGGI